MSKERLINLISRLGGEALATAEAQIEKLLPAFAKVNFGSGFERDFRKEGFDLAVKADDTVEDIDLLSGEIEFDPPVSFLRSKETSIKGEEMCKRALELGANYSQRDGEKLKNWFNNTLEGKEARKELKGLYLPLTGTVWVSRKSRGRYVACLVFFSGECCLSLHYLGSGYGASDRLLPVRKKS